jgi:hypothetical protein
MADTFYRWFSERKLTGAGASRRKRIEGVPPWPRHEVHAAARRHARDRSWPWQPRESGSRGGLAYHGVEASRVLADELMREGLDIVHAWTPPIPAATAARTSCMPIRCSSTLSGIDAAREFVAESRRILRSKGVLFVVVPDYLKERQFFWDIDYTHNFITTERRVRQLLYDGGFNITRVVRKHRCGHRSGARCAGRGGHPGQPSGT